MTFPTLSRETSLQFQLLHLLMDTFGTANASSKRRVTVVLIVLTTRLGGTCLKDKEQKLWLNMNEKFKRSMRLSMKPQSMLCLLCQS